MVADYFSNKKTCQPLSHTFLLFQPNLHAADDIRARSESANRFGVGLAQNQAALRAIYIGATTKTIEQTVYKNRVEIKRMAGHPIGQCLLPTLPYIGFGERGRKGRDGCFEGNAVLVHQRIAHEIAHQELLGLPYGMVGDAGRWHTFGQGRLPTAECVAMAHGRLGGE